MARPKKKNADYFPHDADMRNDPKIKSLRRKYGFKGYAVWVMILEVITDSDYFEYEWSELNIELISGDFDIEPEDLIDIIKYCVRIKLLVNDNGMLYTEKLKERFEGLLSRRKTDRKRKTEEFSTRKTPQEEIIHTEKPQSKVKESKVYKYTEKEFLEDWGTIRKKIKNLPTHITKLKFNELQDFEKASKDFDRSQFQEAMRGLFSQEVIKFNAMITSPKHFLENVGMYYNAFHGKDFKLYGSKPIEY